MILFAATMNVVACLCVRVCVCVIADTMYDSGAQRDHIDDFSARIKCARRTINGARGDLATTRSFIHSFLSFSHGSLSIQLPSSY